MKVFKMGNYLMQSVTRNAYNPQTNKHKHFIHLPLYLLKYVAQDFSLLLLLPFGVSIFLLYHVSLNFYSSCCQVGFYINSSLVQ